MRLFLAFGVPETWRRELERRTARVRDRFPDARWVKPESMHLSLLFLGNIAPSQLDALHAALAPTFARFAAIRLRPTTIGSFPPRGAARVLWLGIESEGQLTALQSAIAQATARVLDRPDLIDDRPFSPHITLARCRPTWPRRKVLELGEVLGRDGKIGDEHLCVHGTLFESDLRPTGAVYRGLRDYELRDA